jgi:hypothetical protein
VISDDAFTDTITAGFQTGALGDSLDLSDLLTNYLPGYDATDYVQFVNIAGDTYINVDANGVVGGASFTTVAVLDSVMLTNVNQAVMEGNLILA